MRSAADIVIRDQAPADRDAVRDVITAAFGQPDEADLVDRLGSDGDSVISLVAADGPAVVGHVLFSRMTAPFRALALAPVSVLPARQRTGIGSRLVRAGLERASEDGWQGVFVVGDPAWYSRFGFDAALAEGFETPYAGPYLMVLPLDGALPAETGRIGHASAFAALE